MGRRMSANLHFYEIHQSLGINILGVGGEKATLTCRLKFILRECAGTWLYSRVSMVNLAAKSTDANVEEVRRGFSAGRGQSGWRSFKWVLGVTSVRRVRLYCR